MRDVPPDPDLLRQARIILVEDAELMRAGGANYPSMSRMAWEERAESSEAGQLVGPREIEAIANLVYGKRRFRR